MDKTQALEILINHSFLLSDDAKIKLLAKLPTLSTEEIDNLGIFLATEKRKSLKNSQQTISDIDKLLTGLDDPSLTNSQ